MPRLIGFHKARELFYFGKKLTPQEAKEIGIVNEVVPNAKLLKYAEEKALELIPPKAAWMGIRLMKRAINKPLIDQLSAALDLENKGLNKAATTYDFGESLKARKEKRTPVFKGK